MSPSKTKSPQKLRAHPRSEIIVAVVLATSIVLFTALLIWLMRPADQPSSTSSGAGTGGLFTRQPRAVLLVILTILAIAGLTYWLLRGRHRPRRWSARMTIAFGVVIVMIVSIVLGFIWPGGLIHHWPPQPKTETSPTPAPTPTTNAAVPTTKAAATPTSSAPAGTTATTGGK
jgi:uncharacterized membrane protein (UPF0182 family)